ncbi:uncharacterized protein RMCB_5691 [Mycolicibacterium brisbanense]|uniref:Uncharacterized protein n=1 Tax=Mycolicibacterium brisbanense TaxID=146020 RepID=A0A117I7G3_9MYCO|nr:uncharacterized protein RMCB_5691 [Mycolicibacterium brisbanense]
MPVDDLEALGVQLLRQCLTLIVEDVRGDHPGALTGQQVRVRRALSLRCAGDQRNLAFQPINHAAELPGRAGDAPLYMDMNRRRRVSPKSKGLYASTANGGLFEVGTNCADVSAHRRWEGIAQQTTRNRPKPWNLDSSARRTHRSTSRADAHCRK